jgi:protein SCO1/2
MNLRTHILAAGMFAAMLFALTVRAGNPGADAGFDQHLDQDIPSTLAFRDENNQPVVLSDYLGGSPVILVFSYYNCSSLCPTVVSSLINALAAAGMKDGIQYQAVVVSIDPRDAPALAALKKAAYLKPDAAHPAQGWHLLTGSAINSATLAQAAGLRYAYDTASGQYVHPAGFLLLTPRGRIARYFFGFEYTPLQLREAVAKAGAQHIASPVAQLLLLCFHFDPATGKYSAAVMRALRLMAAAMFLGALAIFLRRRGKG